MFTIAHMWLQESQHLFDFEFTFCGLLKVVLIIMD